MQVTVVLSRNGERDENKKATEDRLAGLCADQSGLDVLVVPHLYHVPEESHIWALLATLKGHVVFVTWMHPRPTEILLNRHGLSGLNISLKTFNSAEECHGAVVQSVNGAEGSTSRGTISEVGEQPSSRWYPEVDCSRCNNCRHCLQFCLFDVYGFDAAGNIVVTNPDNCKPGCPACSRICPEGAIIFPLYDRDDAISGASGKFMSPDAAARRMIYIYTRRPCPVCGNVVDVSQIRLQTRESKICHECGGVLNDPPKPEPQLSQAATDDIDLLINDLENLTRRRP